MQFGDLTAWHTSRLIGCHLQLRYRNDDDSYIQI